MGAENSLGSDKQPFLKQWLFPATAAACWFVAGLALSRLLFEGLFPAWMWIGRPIPALVFALVTGGLGALVAARFRQHWNMAIALASLPLLLNLVWLVDPAVDLARGRFLFGASCWLAVVLFVWLALGDSDRRWKWLGPLLVTATLLPVYLATMSHAVGVADTFEFQVVASQLGIAHPTGYPLYLLLGKLFSLLPSGTVAWRLNLASAVYAVLAAAIIFRLLLDLLRRPLPGLLGAILLGLTPVFWSQAIVAEVYTLHALIVASALLFMVRLTVDRRPPAVRDKPETTSDRRRMVMVDDKPWLAAYGTSFSDDRKRMVALAFVLGLGLTNHLTTMFLLPPAALAILINLWPAIVKRSAGVSRRRSLIPLFFQLLAAFTIPLLLYLYLPLRWAAVNGEPMGFGRFVEWVAGGRFQGALQWGAWLRDPVRWEIVGRLLLDNWGWFYLALAAVGMAWLAARQWRSALVLLVAAAGFTFYALNYYVPDLTVFLIPTHVVVAISVAAGVEAILDLLETGFSRNNPVSKEGFAGLVFSLLMLPALLAVGDRWPGVDQSSRDGGESWARGVLSQPLARGAAVLADGEKIAPLYYLQQVEGLRPDLDIVVLPDEAAYRAELDARLAAGQSVYLARYLPGLAGVYHLRSAGPLVEASRAPLVEIPAGVITTDLTAGPLRLLAYELEPGSAVDADRTGLTLYWRLDRPLADGEETPVLFLRWAGGDPVVAGLHPAGDSYPVNAWRPEEVVPDYHLLPLPDTRCAESSCPLEVQVAAGRRFSPATELDWQTITSVPIAPRPGPVGAPRRAFFDGFALDGIDFPAAARPGAVLPLRYSGNRDGGELTFLVAPVRALDSLIIPAAGTPTMRVDARESATFAAELEPATETGPHALLGYAKDDLAAVCGWLRWPTTGCVVAEIDITGAPLPEGAVNFDDKIALLDAELEADNLTPGGQLPVTITWQGLAEMSEDYTVFIQVLDAADRIVGQIDAWPVQGTRPTSSWRPGDVITDPYIVQLSADMQPGDYRVIAGLYLLATGQRLPVVDQADNPVDDKVEMTTIPGIQ